MLKPVETAPKGRKAKQDPEPEEAAAESVPHGVRRDHVVTDTGLAAKFNGPKTLGTDQICLGTQLGDQLFGSLWRPDDMSAEDLLQQMAAAVIAVEGIAPRDVMESMLAMQMIATHHAAMECFRRAMLPSQPFEGWDSNLKHAEKLTRIFREQMEALQRYRQKAQPKPSQQEPDAEAKGRKALKRVA